MEYNEGQPYKTEAAPRRSDQSNNSSSHVGRIPNESGLHTNEVFNAYNREPKKVRADIMLGDEDPGSSAWIHRDKLAMIESQEMAEAGLTIPPYRGANNNLSAKTYFSNENSRNGQDPRINGNGYQPTHSFRPSQDNLTDEDEPTDQDFRTPDESATDPYEGSPYPAYRQTGLRASSSRIPLSTSSPVPIPQEHLERLTPLPRKRAASNNRYAGDEDNLMYNKVRSRSRSVGSQDILGDGEATNGSPPSTSNPYYQEMSPGSPKAQKAARTNFVAHQRKISASTRNTSGPKPRVVSTTGHGSPDQRQASRSGVDGRPTTAINRPEGEAPWLATMYKPDPMLPQDQQLLPTHAKRLQQEQRAREGKQGTPLNHDPSPSSIRIHDRLQPPSPALQPRNSKDETQTEKNSAWPLDISIPEPPKSPAATSDHGGYSTVPRMQGTPSIGPVPSPRLPQPMQVQPPLKQLDEKKKGCGCCIVM